MGEVLLDSQPVAAGDRESLTDRLRPSATAFGPALLILIGQQVFFPMSAGLVLRGLVLGGLTAMIALGMAMVYRANRIINFAQADLGLAPAVVSFLLIQQTGLPYPVAFAAGLAIAILFGAAVERLVIRRFFRAPRLLVTIATIGLSQLLVGLALLLPRLWDIDFAVGRLEPPFDATFSVGSVVFNANDILVLVIAPVSIAVVALFLQRSDVGVAIRASADSADRASLLGVPVYRLQTVVWAVAALLAFLTVFLRSGVQGIPTLESALGLQVLIRALVALVVGRMVHLTSVTAAAVALGVLDQGVFSHYGDQRMTFVVLAAVVAVTLIARRAEIGRGDGTEDVAWRGAEEVRPVPWSLGRLPEVKFGRGVAFGLVAAVAIGIPYVLEVDQVFKGGTLLIYALLGLALVLLSGWGGIISLGHIAYFALGAAFGGWLMLEHGLDLLPVLVLAACLGAGASTIVGVPTLRLRGMYLAVSSLAFALAASTYLLDRDRFKWVPISNQLIERPPILGGFEVTSERGAYYIALFTLFVTILGVRNIRSSRFGRALVALRDNERAAQAYSVSPVRLRLAAFALSGAIASLAGALFTFQQRTYDSSSFDPLDNLAVFAMVVIGGMTSATGAVLGALYFWGTRWFLDDQWAIIAQGAGVIVVLLLFPKGLAGVVFGFRDRALRAVARARRLDVPGYTRRTASDAVAAADALMVLGVDDTPDLATQPAPTGAPVVPAVAAAGPEPAAAAAEPPVDRRELLLDARGVKVAYGGVPILFGIDLAVRKGEAVALLGTNGAGKSTLLRAISGLVTPKDGSIRFDDHDITGGPAHRVARRGLLQMPGGQGIFPTLSVADNLRVASWLHRRDKAAVAAGIERVEVLFPVLRARADERASNLSGGQQQMLALGMALLGKPKLLMIDELSLGLAPTVVAQLMKFVDHLRDEGTTLLVVEQSVNVALGIADRAVFLERGEVRFSGPAQDLLDRPDLLRSVFLSSASTVTAEAAELADGPAAPRSVKPNGGSGGAAAPPPLPVLETLGLTVAFGGLRAVDDVTLAIEPGEIVGVIGPNGAGKTTLFDLLSGFVPPTGGKVLLAGRDVSHLRAAGRARRGLGRSFQDARLFTSLTVDQTIAVAVERWVQVGDPLSAAFHLPNVYDSEQAVRRRVNELVELLGLQPYRSLFVGELSTGTRRVVDLACLLAHRPSVVLLDEPASGIAQREVEALAPLIRRVRDEMGASVVLVEHDIPLVEEVADRMVAMDRGRVLAVGTPAEVLADPAVVSSYLGDNATAVNRSDRRTAPPRPAAAGHERDAIRATEQ